MQIKPCAVGSKTWADEMQMQRRNAKQVARPHSKIYKLSPLLPGYFIAFVELSLVPSLDVQKCTCSISSAAFSLEMKVHTVL